MVFGLFKKKKAAQPQASVESVPPAHAAPAQGAPPMSFQPPAVCADWDRFIAEVQGRLQELLQQKVAESEPLIAAVQGDTQALMLLWGAVEHQMQNLQEEISDRWDEVCDELADDESASEELVNAEGQKRDLGNLELELAYLGAYREVCARAAKKMMDWALNEDARTRFCSECGGPLVSFLIGQAQNIQCPACGADQTVEPGQSFRMFAASGARWVGEWDAFPHFQAMKRFECQIQQYRNSQDVPLELLKSYHDAAQEYWGTAFGVEAQLVPQMAKDIPNKVAAMMKGAQKLLRQHWQWRSFEEGNA